MCTLIKSVSDWKSKLEIHKIFVLGRKRIRTDSECLPLKQIIRIHDHSEWFAIIHDNSFEPDTACICIEFIYKLTCMSKNWSNLIRKDRNVLELLGSVQKYPIDSLICILRQKKL